MVVCVIGHVPRAAVLVVVFLLATATGFVVELLIRTALPQARKRAQNSNLTTNKLYLRYLPKLLFKL